MLRSLARYAMAYTIVCSCAIVMALTPDECDRQEYARVSNILRKIESCCDLLVAYLQRVLARPKSRPMVKYKRPKRTVRSYQFISGRSAHMTIKILVATAATRNGLNQLHFDLELVPIRIDNCCLRCITNDVRDLVPLTIKTMTKVVRGFKGEECAATCHGTL